MSLLNYPGCLGDINLASAKTIDTIKKFEIENIISPFITGGYFEIYIASKGVNVEASSQSQHIVDMWDVAKNNMPNLVDKIIQMLEHAGGNRNHFSTVVQNRYEIENKLEKTALNIILNRLTRNGGSMRPVKKNQYFSNYAIQSKSLYKKSTQGQLIFDFDFTELLELDLQNISVSKANPIEVVKQNTDNFLFLYPPSVMYPKPVQGDDESQMENFDHKALHKALLERDKWILLAEDDGFISQTLSDDGINIQEIKSFKVTDTYNLLLITKA